MLKRAVVLSLVALAACTPPRVLTLAPANPSEYAAFSGAGRGAIQGQAFLNTAGGLTRRAAGAVVYLDPATSLARAWCDSAMLQPPAVWKPLPIDATPTDPAFLAARRSTKGDADGNFAFSNLRPGRYLLTTVVQWETGSAMLGTQGGRVWELVTVPDTGVAHVVMNQVDNPWTRGARP